MRIVIIGAGPCGLGAAWRLHELGHDNWCLLEASDSPGGLASSFERDGFTWDIGGHVGFSHYEYYDNVMRSLPIEWLEHPRNAWMRVGESWVPYPVQNNLHRLPVDMQVDAFIDMVNAHNSVTWTDNFNGWLLSAFGWTLRDKILRPYNEKVWAHSVGLLSTSWMGERVAVPDARKVLASMISKEDQVAWGPNSTFSYPTRGGTGSIWREVASKLSPLRLMYKTQFDGIDLEEHQIAYSHDGQGYATNYDALISTMPITRLCSLCEGAAPTKLSYSSTHAVGVGLRGELPEFLRDKSWLYFPGDDCPFYRVTVLSNYSPNMTPVGCWSLLCETSESKHKPVDSKKIVQETIFGLENAGLIEKYSRSVVSTWHKRVEHGYPTPTVNRDVYLNMTNNILEKRNVYSRGRFGAWKYEVSNQDHSFMQGVEIVDRLLLGKEEMTLNYPDSVNGGKKVPIR